MASFAWENAQWSLWLPELTLTDHPLTPASQVFFPVILRHDEQAFAIRFYYDCATGKVRYYTSAIPDDIARLPEFENAVSELFRHSVAVEPVRPRNLGRRGRRAPEPPPKPRSFLEESLAEPAEKLVPVPAAPLPAPGPISAPPAPTTAFAIVPPPPPPAPTPPPVRELAIEAAENPAPVVEARHVRIEIGPRVRHVLLALILMVGAILLAALGIYGWIQSHQDPGVEHHRLQIEEMRLREGR
jgi:hypothetical protein